MNKKELEQFARKAAKEIKTEQDLSEFSQTLTKVVIETALNAELDINTPSTIKLLFECRSMPQNNISSSVDKVGSNH